MEHVKSIDINQKIAILKEFLVVYNKKSEMLARKRLSKASTLRELDRIALSLIDRAA